MAKYKTKMFKKDILLESVLDKESWLEEDIEFIEASGWEADGKYQYQSYIFKHDGKFYEICDSRSGSPFSEYYYESEDWDDEVECSEVEKVEVTTYEWKTIKE